MGRLFIYGARNKDMPLEKHPKTGFAGIETDPLDEYENVLLYTRRLTDRECCDSELDRLGTRYEQ